MTVTRPKKWEVWLAKVRYEDNPAVSKKRPVLVVAPGQAYILSLKITSHAPRGWCQDEIVLKNWSGAGLNRCSTVRCSKKLKLKDTDFVHKLGTLTPADILAIQKTIGR